MSQEYTNISDLPTLSYVSSPTYVPVEDTNKAGKKVDLSKFKPGTLSTTSSGALQTDSSESLVGDIALHKVSKTGTYADIINKPRLNTISTDSRSTGEETINGTIYLHPVAKTGRIESMSTSSGTWVDAPYVIDVNSSKRLSLKQANLQNYMYSGHYTSNYDFYDGTADDLYDIPDYGVTLAYIWKPGRDSRWNCLDLEEYYATYGGDDVIWDNKDIETIRIIIPVSGESPDTIPEGYLKILPVSPSAEDKMPTSVDIAISFNENFGTNPVYDASFENDDTPLTCVSGPSVINTTKEGFIKVYDRYYEIVQF